MLVGFAVAICTAKLPVAAGVKQEHQYGRRAVRAGSALRRSFVEMSDCTHPAKLSSLGVRFRQGVFTIQSALLSVDLPNPVNIPLVHISTIMTTKPDDLLPEEP